MIFQRFDFEGFVAVGHFGADAAARGQRHHLVSGEFPLVQNVEHFTPDIAGRSDQRDFVTHRSLSEEIAFPGRLRAKRGKTLRFYARNALKTTPDLVPDITDSVRAVRQRSLGFCPLRRGWREKMKLLVRMVRGTAPHANPRMGAAMPTAAYI